MIDIDDDYSVIEIIAPERWAGKSLKALELRVNYGINVLGIRKRPHEKLTISPSADYVIEKSDQLLVIADTALFEKFEYLGKL
jgi:trk system potassium uptake protein